MNKRQTRLFAIASTAVAASPSWGSRSTATGSSDELTNADELTPQVHSGQGRLAQVQLHQLPHAVRRRRLLRARPHEDHASFAASSI